MLFSTFGAALQALAVGENLGREAFFGENVLPDILNGLKAIQLLTSCLRFMLLENLLISSFQVISFCFMNKTNKQLLH